MCVAPRAADISRSDACQFSTPATLSEAALDADCCGINQHNSAEDTRGLHRSDNACHPVSIELKNVRRRGLPRPSCRP